ncbi:AsmA family protein [Rhodoferax sp.]|uniref:AsmA family protein n=1 Tax=Rhodoferax sp. TaxID=50421 RepID=UPI00284921FF|nr:AsmA family protein [Rhodoferax sp.]MDR3370977.1 AsmA family protein [Rhodoferax sp.]
MVFPSSSVLRRFLLWTGAALLTGLLLVVLAVALFGWNWLRAPIERMTLQKTGRALVVSGDLTVGFGWPVARLHAAGVSFANPAWAKEKQMVTAEGVEVSLDLSTLLQRSMSFTEVRLDHAAIYLEQSTDKRKSWLLDTNQQDESARIHIGRVALDHGTLGYDDAGQKTSLRAELSTASGTANSAPGLDLSYSVTGQFKGMPVKVQGSGGPVLALRDTSQPYPLKLTASVGPTDVQVDGTITGLLALSAVDVQMALRGGSLEQLYPLLGIAFPVTRGYTAEGHLLHTDKRWRFEKFTGRVGASDIVGFVEVNTGGKRPALSAAVTSHLLALDDLGPMIGARSGSVAQAVKDPLAQKRVLPDLPFNAERWDSVDADVQLSAKTLRRAEALPLEDLTVHLNLRDSVLTLDPLNFGLAGGQLQTRITLDGRSSPIQATAQVRAHKLLLAKLFPTVDLNQTSIGQINGEFDLTGSGNSVGGMLASSNGKLGLMVAGGQISKLMLEKAGLHLWEILTLSLTGDKQVKLRCAVADFNVKAGVMQTEALVFDTQVTTLLGSGSIDLAHEKLDLTLTPKTKATSPVALRSPIYVRGSFAQPQLSIDKGQVAARAAGAVALGLVNPILALLPLIDAGPGQDSDCGQLVRDARALPHVASPHTQRQ